MLPADTFRLLRTAFHNLTQAQLEELSGIRLRVIARIENGKVPITQDVLVLLAKTYNIRLIPLTRLFEDLKQYNIDDEAEYNIALNIIRVRLLTQRIQ